MHSRQLYFDSVKVNVSVLVLHSTSDLSRVYPASRPSACWDWLPSPAAMNRTSSVQNGMNKQHYLL